MAALRRWIFVLTLLFAAGLRVWAASPADRAFEEAKQAFHDTVYDRAEAQLADFCQKNPTSPRLAEAILLQAQARLELTNYAGAIELLTANQGKAGTSADQYLFWLGEAYSRKGDWRAASDTFAKLAKEQPTSALCLEANVREAAARSALARMEPAEWQRVLGMLQQTNGAFQLAVATNAAGDLVPRGYLLLSEAQLATKDYRAAEATLLPLAKRLLPPTLSWQWQYLLCRIQLADGRTNAALQGTTNLLAIAANGSQTNLLAESAAFRAGLLERLGQTNEAIISYRQNLAASVPTERRRHALLKIIELSLAQDKIPQATQTLEEFLAQYPDSSLADLALLTLGELRLRQHEAGVPVGPPAPGATNALAATNNLQLAQESFSTLVKKFPQSPLFGKAQLDLGWCYGRQGKLPEAQAAYQVAVERLPPSKDQATAYFRLADIQFQQTNYAGAIKSYQAIIGGFASLPEVKTNLFEPALFETVRAALAGGDLATATNTVQSLLTGYPTSTNAASAALLTAQEISRRGDQAAARKLLLDFDKATPAAPLQAERLLAVAATYEQEKNWAEAITQHESWLAAFPTNAATPRVQFDRAWDTFQAGRLTNALALFVDFVARFQTNKLAARAQIWVADYYYNLGNPMEAERNYKLLLQSTNWPPSDLTYEAQLMAGRAAAAHHDWKAAKAYFLGLHNNTNGPSIDQRLQALFEHGNALMQVVDPDETNKLANLEEATRVFGLICDYYPTSSLAVRAWGERANCYLQWGLAKQQYDSLTNALNAYQRVIDSPQAEVAARSEARLGQAITLAKWAAQKAGEPRTAMLKQALSNCLDVVYGRIRTGDSEQLDQFWSKEAAIKAFDLAEELRAWPQAVFLYERLTNNVWPQPPASLQKRAAQARENLEREKAAR